MSDRHTPVPDDDAGFDSTLTEQPLAAGQPTPLPDATADTGIDVKATGSRAPSRSTRILLGALLLALAAFIWFNYVWQPEQPQVLVNGNGTSISGGLGTNGINSAVPLVASDPGSGQLPVIAGGNDNGRGEAGTAATPTDDEVVVVPLPGVVARDLEIVELPFLVTQPPAPDLETEAGATEDAVTRPSVVRASVNPFSPVVLAEPEAVADSGFTPTPTIPGGPPPGSVIEVSIPDGPNQSAITTISPPAGSTPADRPAGSPGTTQPAAAPVPVAVPVPEPATPSASAPAAQPGGSLAQSLPRPLPGPSLSPVPSVLQERRAVEDVPTPNLAQVTAVEEPVGPIDPSVADRLPDEDGAAPDVLPPVANRVMPSDADPLVAGITPLSRYLRDYDVTFTGMVLGPVSQGVFRSNAAPRPVVVGLGQNLPETEIILTDLRGQQAEFTLADATQFLTLDLRR